MKEQESNQNFCVKLGDFRRTLTNFQEILGEIIVKQLYIKEKSNASQTSQKISYSETRKYT